MIKSLSYYVKKGTTKLVLTSAFSFLTLFATAQTFVSDSEDLQDMVNASSGGEIFVVPDGTYTDFEASFSANGAEGNPIIIKAETVGGVKLIGDSHFTFKKASNIILEGFDINAEGSSTLVKLEGCNNIRITRNVFKLTTTDPIKWVFIGGVWDDNALPFVYPSHNNRIDHNIFKDKATPGHYITVDGTTDTQDVGYQSQYDVIDHNHFMTNSPRAVNEQESIRVGWSEMSKSSGFTTVEFNLFEDCDGDPEIVSIKSSDNTVRHNTFKSSYGTLSFRHGNRNRAEGNYFFGNGKEIGLSPDGATLYTGGIRIYGTDHVIINNYMEGLTGTIWDAPIALTQGDAIEGNSTNLTKHFRAERVTIAYNTLVNNVHGIEVGYDKPGNNAYNTSLKDITIANNLVTGSENSMVEFINGNDQGEEITWANNLMYPTGTATLLVGASTTTFGTDAVSNINPNLTLTDGVWRSSATSPTITSGAPFLDVIDDIDGQSRPATSNFGADHYSLESVRYKPMTETTVGPYAYEDVIIINDFLNVNSSLTFDSNSETKTISISSNIDWTLTETADWISLGNTSGSSNGTVDATVLENSQNDSRTAIITVTGPGITRTITVTQNGTTIVAPDSSITVTDVIASTFQDPNTPLKAIDDSISTRWSGEGVGESITFTFDDVYDLTNLNVAFLSGDIRSSYFSVEISTDGIDFTPISSGLTSSGTTNDMEQYDMTGKAKYVRVVGGGNSVNAWNSITEIKFYGTLSTVTSVSDRERFASIEVFPVPTQNKLTLKLNSDFKTDEVSVVNMSGETVMDIKLSKDNTEHTLDLNSLKNGTYLLKVNTEEEVLWKRIIISK